MKVYHHTTPAMNVESILKEGLRPGYISGQRIDAYKAYMKASGKEEDPPADYMSDIDWAHQWACARDYESHYSEQPEPFKYWYAIFKVYLTDEQAALLEEDDELYGAGDWVHDFHIDPCYIELFGVFECLTQEEYDRRF